MVEVILT